ncbi:hypothetical protein L9F63_021609, partial [Diploptera punctata]
NELALTHKSVQARFIHSKPSHCVESMNALNQSRREPMGTNGNRYFDHVFEQKNRRNIAGRRRRCIRILEFWVISCQYYEKRRLSCMTNDQVVIARDPDDASFMKNTFFPICGSI